MRIALLVSLTGLLAVAGPAVAQESGNTLQSANGKKIPFTSRAATFTVW